MFRLNEEKSFVKRPEPFKTFICKLLLAGVNEWRIPSFRGWSHLHLTVEQKKGGEFFFRRLFFPNFYNFFRFLQLRFCFAWFCFFQVFLLSQFFFQIRLRRNLASSFFAHIIYLLATVPPFGPRMQRNRARSSVEASLVAVVVVVVVSLQLLLSYLSLYRG